MTSYTPKNDVTIDSSLIGRKWAHRFMEQAKLISSWSKDRTKIGAICVSLDKRILSTGYNGFPAGISDDERLLDRETKYKLVIHAELNVILNAAKNGVSINDSIVFIYGLPPCSDCSKTMIQAGIKEVWFMVNPDVDSEKWRKSFETSKEMFDEAGIQTYEIKKLCTFT
jgi:dCMP deaminase